MTTDRAAAYPRVLNELMASDELVATCNSHAALPVYRPQEWSSHREYLQTHNKWLRGRGIDPADMRTVLAILQTSKRIHARTVRELPSLDRAWIQADSAGWAKAPGMDNTFLP